MTNRVTGSKGILPSIDHQPEIYFHCSSFCSEWQSRVKGILKIVFSGFHWLQSALQHPDQWRAFSVLILLSEF
jgi:hypothetical protein